MVNAFVPMVPTSVRVLEPFVRDGVFGASEVQTAAHVKRLVAGTDRENGGGRELLDEEVLALAVAARAPRIGHVCVELEHAAERLDPRTGSDLPWPEPTGWAALISSSSIVHHPARPLTSPVRPLVWDGGRLYLHRYWSYEISVAGALASRTSAAGIDVAEADLDTLFPAPPGGQVDLQRVAAKVALGSGVSVIGGGPGTGKTRTVARLLIAALSARTGAARDFALAAPTGKAAARMTEAVRAATVEAERDGLLDPVVRDRLATAEATTIHRLLGARPGVGFTHDRRSPLPHDLVVVDETSMVDLPLMARLLDAVRAEARLVLVGDPDQLVSVEAGSVLADLVGEVGFTDRDHRRSGPLAGHVTILERVHRFGAESGIAALAGVVRRGDADGVLSLLAGGRDDLAMVEPSAAGIAAVLDEVTTSGAEVIRAAREGRALDALNETTAVKVLCATNHGPNGRTDWATRIERAVEERVGGLHRRGGWYVGRPMIATSNDNLNRISNGDTGVGVTDDGSISVALADRGSEDGFRLVPPARIEAAETWWSMTIHKSQGSEFGHAVVALPADAASPVLSRQLLYTAVTRARESLTVVATPEAIRAAVERPVARASGLADRLWA